MKKSGKWLLDILLFLFALVFLSTGLPHAD